jgi:hypothetical protein
MRGERVGLGEIGISYLRDELNLADDPCTIAVKNDETSDSRLFGVLLQHGFRGKDLFLFLSSLLGETGISRIVTFADWSLPDLARRPARTERDQHYKDLHRIHQIDPYIGSAYQEFDRYHVREWRQQLMKVGENTREGLYPLLAWKLAAGERSYLSQLEAHCFTELSEHGRGDVVLGRVWAIYASSEDVRVSVAKEMELLYGNHSRPTTPIQLAAMVSLLLIPEYEGSGEERRVIKEHPGPAALVLSDKEGVLAKLEAYAAKL